MLRTSLTSCLCCRQSQEPCHQQPRKIKESILLWHDTQHGRVLNEIIDPILHTCPYIQAYTDLVSRATLRTLRSAASIAKKRQVLHGC